MYIDVYTAYFKNSILVNTFKILANLPRNYIHKTTGLLGLLIFVVHFIQISAYICKLKLYFSLTYNPKIGIEQLD